MSERHYGYKDIYQQWLTDSVFDQDTRDELFSISSDEKEIEDRFYRELAFGTAGLRGILGAGTNRMNLYTVGKVTQGLCDMLLGGEPRGDTSREDTSRGVEPHGGAAGGNGDVVSARERGVVISYDPRHMSLEFAERCASIIAGNGIHAWLFDELRPTPELSFAVRHLNCAAGIMITASHNPSAYNGYKVYGDDGAQMGVAESDRVVLFTSKIKSYGDIKLMPLEEAKKQGLLTVIGKDIDDIYVSKVRTLSLRLQELRADDIAANGNAADSNAADSVLSKIKIIYTPLHGTGNKLVRRVLRENGFLNVIVVPEQELPDPDFPTVKSPNPDTVGAFELAISLAKKENVDLIIATDPDCDRIGVVYKGYDGDYTLLSGNQIGCLLLEYVLTARKSLGTLDTGRAFAVKSIVTTKLANLIAARHGVELCEVFTGFKYICEMIKERDEFGNGEFVFGFEESNGYLAGNFVRDKDGVIASMLLAEMAAWYASKGQTLADAFREINETYGYTRDDVVSYTLPGKEGLSKIDAAMKALRREPPKSFGSYKVKQCTDFLTEEIIAGGTGEVIGHTGMSEKANVLSYLLEDGSVFQIRPSGTEPKIKVYYGVTADTDDMAKKCLDSFEEAVDARIKSLLGI